MQRKESLRGRKKLANNSLPRRSEETVARCIFHAYHMAERDAMTTGLLPEYFGKLFAFFSVVH